MKTLRILGLAAAFWGCSDPAAAQTFTLSDVGSAAVVDPDYGMSSWWVGGVNQSSRQWFWFRIGSTGGETMLNSGILTAASQSDARQLSMTFSSVGIEIRLNYSLYGLTALGADIANQITIINNNASARDIHFFQYWDFDLNGTESNNRGRLASPGRIVQWNGTAALSETVSSHLPNHYQISTYPTLVNSLGDFSPTTASDTPLQGITIGPADLEWGFQWDIALGPGASVTWAQDATITLVIAGPDLQVAPTNDFVSFGGLGGPFTPAASVYTLTNNTANSLNWSASRDANWLSLSAASGTLPGGGQTNVTVSLNANANALARGTYGGTVSFANISTGSGNTTRRATLTAYDPMITSQPARSGNRARA